MTAATWAPSPTYGRAVALGPTQRAVLDVALRLTTHGRRPQLTLGRLAELSGRPVSSVHDALGRLRALGLIGVSARMGRTGGHRLWRVTGRGARQLDDGRHRRAIARIMARFGAMVRTIRSGGTAGMGAAAVTARTGTLWGWSSSTASHHDGSAGLPPADPSPDPEERWWDKPPRIEEVPGETFAEKMRRYGLGDWISTGEDPDHDGA